MSALKLQLRLSHTCVECGHPINTARKSEAQIMLRLFGLKKGWRVCRCWERIIAKLKGATIYRDILSECEVLGPGGNPFDQLPEADDIIVKCPPGAAADALTHAEWMRL